MRVTGSVGSGGCSGRATGESGVRSGSTRGCCIDFHLRAIVKRERFSLENKTTCMKKKSQSVSPCSPKMPIMPWKNLFDVLRKKRDIVQRENVERQEGVSCLCL